MIWRFLDDEGGATAIEYALIAALVALAIMGGLGSFANSMNKLWTNTAERLDAVLD